MTAITVPTARKNLVTLLRAAYADSVQVTFTPPRFEDAQVVSILGVKDVQTEFAQIGRNTPSYTEAYDIEVMIKHLDRGAQHAEVDDVDAAAWELYSTLVETVQQNPTLDGALTDGWSHVATVEGGSGVVPALVGDPDAEPDEIGAAETQGFVEFIPAMVRCQARI